MKKTIGAALAGACLLVLAGAGPAWSQAKGGSIQVNASPSDAKVTVWIDGKPAGSAPAGKDLPEGVYQVRVRKDTGETYERKVVVKPDARIDIVADFDKREISVRNEKALGYNPYESGTVRIMSGADPAPVEDKPPPAEDKVPEAVEDKPAEAVAGAGDQPVDPGPSADPRAPGYRECAPGEWCPEPAANAIGPPIPPQVRKTGPAASDKTDTAKLDPKAVEKKPEPAKPGDKKPEPAKPEERKPAIAPCLPRTSPDACDLYAGAQDPRNVLYSYYCALTNHELERAFGMWSIGQDLSWFYESSAPFCAADDFRLRNIQSTTGADGQVLVNYSLDLIDGRGRVIETRAMAATLVKRGDSWAFRRNVRQ